MCLCGEKPTRTPLPPKGGQKADAQTGSQITGKLTTGDESLVTGFFVSMY